jgi:hypothetical protein
MTRLDAQDDLDAGQTASAHASATAAAPLIDAGHRHDVAPRLGPAGLSMGSPP